MPKWQCSVKDIVIFGRIPNHHTDVGSRWIIWDAPWTEDVREYECPMRITYFGKKFCWSFGARSQYYDWKRRKWTDEWKRFVVYPR